ncbi:MAG: AmmeMemoRadiSam system protein A [Chloroflexi bacterium]|nr:MAG: AmmeMemoRadiSam system protein A [Chloroflexota bacterium]
MSHVSHPLVLLARHSLDEYVRHGQRAPLPRAPEYAPYLEMRAGVFVSLHKKNGDLRGCVGTFMPTRANVADEVIENAIAAATRDPRFAPLQEQELGALDVSVDVLSEPEPVASFAELDPQVYGVIVSDRDGMRRGLLLPMLEQVTTVEQQVAIAKQKASIDAAEPTLLWRFRVQRFH